MENNMIKEISCGSYYNNNTMDYAKIKITDYNLDKHKFCFTLPYIYNRHRNGFCDQNDKKIDGGITRTEIIKITPISLYRYIIHRINSYFHIRKFLQKYKRDNLK